jgi:hypothetical protein
MSGGAFGGGETGDLGPRFAWHASAWLVAACGALWLAAWVIHGSPWAWPRFDDDAYYYLQIARNAASGHGFTEDQLTPTNGFQPLWMWLLVPLAWLTRGDETFLLAAARLTSVAVFCAAGGVLCGLVRARLGRLPALAAGVVFVAPRFMNNLVSGLESGLAVWMLALSLREALARGALDRVVPARSDARLGFWFGLLMLARLDAVFVLLAAAAQLGWLALRDSGTPLAPRLVRALAKGLSVFWPVLLLVLPYLAYNYVAFGHLVPVSGVLKSTFPRAGLRLENLNPAFGALLALGALGLAVETARGRGRAPLTRVLAWWLAGTASQALYSILFMNWAVFSWHFALFIPLGALGAALVTRELAERSPRSVVRGMTVAALAGLAVTLGVSLVRLPRTFAGAAREAGLWVARELPPDALLGMKDSGAFSYYAGRRVVNLDGVVNSFAYAETICRGELPEYLRALGVGYIAQHAVPPDVQSGAYQSYRARYPCHLAGGRDSELELLREREVYRGTPYIDYTGHEGQLVIWRIGE